MSTDMKTPLDTVEIEEDRLRETAEHECAHAVAYEVRAEGVEEVSIEPDATSRGRCKPHSVEA